MIIAGISAALILFFVYYFVGFVENEGFNPTDDGWILSQSWRLINGEVPHKDFISLRPVFSGILHSLNFYSPLPLEISARWFTFFQLLFVSVLWSYILFRKFAASFAVNIILAVCFFALCVFTFALTNFNFGIFPWTTSDAVFFSSISVAFTVIVFSQAASSRCFYVSITVALIFASIAALCRQSFIFFFIAQVLLTAGFLRKERKLIFTIPIVVLGSMPFIAYAVYLLYHDAFYMFLEQMTRRSEFFETAIVRYVKSFIKSQFSLFFIVIFSVGVYFFIRKTSGTFVDRCLQFLKYAEGKKQYITIVYIILNILLITVSVRLLLYEDIMFMMYTFDMFWLSIVSILTGILISKFSKVQYYLIIIAIVISWCGSISLGANSPLFTKGIMAAVAIMSFVHTIRSFNIYKILPKHYRYIYIGLFLFSAGILSAAFYGHRRINYRDLPSVALSASAEKIIPEMGAVRINSNMLAYFSELKEIYEKYSLKNKFSVIPACAIVYPMLKSRNPFPIDWMDRYEYIFYEDTFFRMLRNSMDRHSGMYILADKYDVKELATGLKPMKFNSVMMDYYNQPKYSYYDTLLNRCDTVSNSYKFFLVLKVR